MESYLYGQAEGSGDLMGRGNRGYLLGCAVGARVPYCVGQSRLEEQATFLSQPDNA